MTSWAYCRVQITILDDSLPWIHTLAILCQLSSLGLLNLNVILAPLFCLTHSLGLPVLKGLGSSSFTLVFLREFFCLFLEQSLLKRLPILLSNSNQFKLFWGIVIARIDGAGNLLRSDLSGNCGSERVIASIRTRI